MVKPFYSIINIPSSTIIKLRIIYGNNWGVLFSHKRNEKVSGEVMWFNEKAIEQATEALKWDHKCESLWKKDEVLCKHSINSKNPKCSMLAELGLVE